MTSGLQLITAALVAAGAGNARPSMQEHPAVAKRIADFKARIHFDALAAKETRGKGVVAEWPGCAALLGLTEKDWAGDWSSDNALSLFDGRGIAERECTLERAGEQIWVRMYVSVESSIVRERLVDLANETTMPVSPFVRGPDDLGTLALFVPGMGGSERHFIATFYNVGFAIRREGGARDIAPLVRNAIAFARRHLVDRPEAHAPRVKRLEVPRTLRVGEVAEVKLELEPADADLRVDCHVSYQTLRQNRDRDGTLTITGDAPGEGEVELRIADRKTLLNIVETRTVRVGPAKQAP